MCICNNAYLQIRIIANTHYCKYALLWPRQFTFEHFRLWTLSLNSELSIWKLSLRLFPVWFQQGVKNNLMVDIYLCSWGDLSYVEIFGATSTPVLDFWWCLIWNSKPQGAASFMLGMCAICFIHSLRFTSGLTPADLFVASMAAKSFSATYLWAGNGRGRGLKTRIYHATTHSVTPGR